MHIGSRPKLSRVAGGMLAIFVAVQVLPPFFGFDSPFGLVGGLQTQNDPTACEAVGNNWTNCQDAFSSNNIYAYANDTTGDEGPVAFDAASNTTGDDVDSISWSHPTGSGTDRLLGVGVSLRQASGATTVDNVRYGGTPLSLLRADTNAGATSNYPGTETLTTGSNCGGTFPTDLQSSNNAYLCYRESGTGGGAISFDAASSGTAGLISPFSWTHTTVSTTDGLIAVGVALRQLAGATTVTGVTYDGNALTHVAGADSLNAGNVRTELWYRIGTLSGGRTVEVTLSANEAAVGGAVTFTGAHQSAPIGNTGTATGNSANPSVAITSATDEIVMDVVGAAHGAASPCTPGGGQTERWDTLDGGGGGAAVSCGSTEPGAASVTMDWTLSSGRQWAISTVGLKPAPSDFQLSVQHDWSGIPTGGDSYDLCVEAHITNAGGESMLVQVLTPPATWNTRITVTKTADDNADQCYTLTTTEFDSGAPSIRWMGGTETGDSTQSDINIDHERVVRNVGVRTELWYLVAPASGTGTITVNLSASERVVGGAVSLTGVDQTTPLENAGGATGNSVTPSVTITSATDDMVWDVVGVAAGVTFTEGAGQTKRWDRQVGGGSVAASGAGSTEAGAPSVTMDWTLSTADRWSITAVNVRAPGGLGVDAASSGTAGLISPFSWTHTTVSTTDGLIAVGVALRQLAGATTVTGVTYDGNALTHVAGADSLNAGNVRTELWYRIGTLSGGRTVEVTLSANEAAVGGAVTFTGAHQSAPIGNTGTATGNSANPSVGVTSATDEIVIDVVGAAHGGASPCAPGGGQTERWDTLDGGGGGAAVGCGSTEPGAASVTMDWTLNTGRQWAISAVGLRAGGAGSGPGKNDTAWRDFGFALNASDTVNTVEVGMEWFRNNTAPILNVSVSWDGGATWGTNQTATNKSTDDNLLEFLDFTAATTWSASKLSDSNFRARLGTNASGARLDYVTVRVDFTPANSAPAIANFRLEDGGGQSKAGEQLDVDVDHYYIFNVTDDDGWSDIGGDGNVSLRLWYDGNGSSAVTPAAPTACTAVGSNWTSCNNAFSSDDTYAYANESVLGPVSVDRANRSGAANVTSIEWNHTTGTNSSRLLVVGISLRQATGATTVTDVKYDGASISFYRGDANPGFSRVEIWYLVNPASGNRTVNVTLSSNENVVGGSITLDNVSQASPLDNDATAQGDSDTPSVTVTSEADDMVLDVLAVGDGTGATVDPNQTQQWNTKAGGGPDAVRAAASTQAGEASLAMNWTLGKVKPWVHTGVNVNAASGIAPGMNDTAWRNFGFALDEAETVIAVEVGVEWFRNNTAPILNVFVSWDGGSTWSASQTATNKSADDDTVEWLDFSAATAWNASKLNDTNFRVRVSTNESGPRLDYVTARVTRTSELTFANQTTGANYRIELKYVDTADPSTASLSEWSVTEGRATYNASASSLTAITNGYEFKLALKLGFQVKQANDPTNNSVGGYNDADSWNGEVVANDGTSNTTLQTASGGEHMEFGVFQYTFVDIGGDWNVTGFRGQTVNTNTITVTYRSNDDFNLTIWFTTHLIMGAETIDISNVQILAAADPSDNITVDTPFTGLGESNAVYILGSATWYFPHAADANQNTTMVQFSVSIPFGQAFGTYTAQLTIRIQQRPSA